MSSQGTRATFMPASVHLGRVAGIPIGLHFSWFLIAALITFSLAGYFADVQTVWSTVTVWSVAVATAVLFFVTLVAHELSHAIVARARGLPVRSITLFALGGVAQIEKDANTAKTEFLVAIVGPIASLAIGGVCLLIARGLGWNVGAATSSVTAAVLGWLGSINVMLALFNLIPGYPLDGGRVLRAALWAAYDDADRATRSAAFVGQIVAGLFIAFGVFTFFGGAGFGGLWIAFIGWFLLIAAQASYQQVAIGEALRDVKVADVMVDDCATTSPGMTLQSFVDEILMRTGRRCVIVESGDRVLGLVTPRDVKDVERTRWHEVTVADVMRPLDTLKTVTPATPVAEAFDVMAREDLNQLPVISAGRLQGMVSRGHILRLIQARAELRTT